VDRAAGRSPAAGYQLRTVDVRVVCFGDLGGKTAAVGHRVTIGCTRARAVDPSPAVGPASKRLPVPKLDGKVAVVTGATLRDSPADRQAVRRGRNVTGVQGDTDDLGDIARLAREKSTHELFAYSWVSPRNGAVLVKETSGRPVRSEHRVPERGASSLVG
jgi:hypothetical protein